jgi:hypothetical protein
MCDRISETERAAQTALIFGDADRAIVLYGRAIKCSWRVSRIDCRLVRMMCTVTEMMLDNGMDDDAFDGIRSMSLALARRNDEELALELVRKMKDLHSAHPGRFPGVASLERYVRALLMLPDVGAQ